MYISANLFVSVACFGFEPFRICSLPCARSTWLGKEFCSEAHHSSAKGVRQGAKIILQEVVPCRVVHRGSVIDCCRPRHHMPLIVLMRKGYT